MVNPPETQDVGSREILGTISSVYGPVWRTHEKPKIISNFKIYGDPETVDLGV